MIDFYLAPRRYVQKEGILFESGSHVKAYGQRPLVVGDALVFSLFQDSLRERYREAGLSPVFALFGEECSQTEVERIVEIARKEKADCMVGLGGGKSIDTSRLVSDRLNCPLITLPTSASTCSAASSMAVIYKGGVRQANLTGKGADSALVDSLIISQAPVRLLVAGMGDALAKWYEGKPSYDQLNEHDSAIRSAMILSTQIKETIFTYGLEAKQDVEMKRNSGAVEAIIEANILLTGVVSGLGGTRFRAAAAHALLYGLTIHPEIHHALHGEVVAFGTLVQLCLEKKESELKTLLPFFSRLGLPLTLSDIGISNHEDPLFWEGLERTCAKGSTLHNLPFPVDPQKLYHAIRESEERAETLKR